MVAAEPPAGRNRPALVQLAWLGEVRAGVSRLIDPDDGQVLLDGVGVDTLDPARLRREIGYAFDRPVLLGGTVSETLCYGRPELDRATLMRAARVAHADGLSASFRWALTPRWPA